MVTSSDEVLRVWMPRQRPALHNPRGETPSGSVLVDCPTASGQSAVGRGATGTASTVATAGWSPGAVALNWIGPAVFDPWTMAQQSPLNARRAEPLSDSWSLGS